MASAQPSSVPTVSALAGRVDRLASKSSKPKARSTDEHEAEEAADLVVGLLGRAVDVAVVLGEAPDPHEAVERAGLLVAVDRAQLEQAQRQLPVGALAGVEDQVVARAVHGLRVVLAVVHLHGRVHAVLVEAEVARGLEQLPVGDVGRVDELVAALGVALAASSPP